MSSLISAGAMNIAAALINQGRRYKRGHFSLLASYNNNLKITPKAASFFKKIDFWSRLEPPTGTKGPLTGVGAQGHVEAHWSRFWFEPGLMGGGISNDPLVPVHEPGLKALTNRDY